MPNGVCPDVLIPGRYRVLSVASQQSGSHMLHSREDVRQPQTTGRKIDSCTLSVLFSSSAVVVSDATDSARP